jgi:uncharacterized protein (AIM24 family)
MNRVLNPANLPVDDNINPYSFCVDLAGEWFMQKGRMIAYYGQIKFNSLNSMDNLQAMVANQFSSPLYARDWVVASGQGKLVLGDRGFDINSYDLDDGNLTVRAANLLAFSPGLALKQSIVPGFLTLIGTGKFLASSNGPVMFAEPPVRVDPQALLGWADCPSPAHHHDAAWMSSFLSAAQGFFGRMSGEERQLDFTGAGTVLLQSSEVVREDASLLAAATEQTNLLSQGQLSALHRTIGAKLQNN